MELDHEGTDPLYVQLAGILREQIKSGELTGRVPSAKTLAQQYGIATGTAEKALAALREEDLIFSSSGRGHFVRK